MVHGDDCELLGPDCEVECVCGRGHYPECKYQSCYECFLDRREEYINCIICGRWHNPEFDTCYKCRPETRGRDDAALALRQLIHWRDGPRCHHCKIETGERQFDPRRAGRYDNPDDWYRSAQMHVDHIIPCAKGGKADEWNLQILCGLCNVAKGSKWYPWCRYEQDRTRLARIYLLAGPTYFAPSNWRRFYAEVELWRATSTWDPAIHETELRERSDVCGSRSTTPSARTLKPDEPDSPPWASGLSPAPTPANISLTDSSPPGTSQAGHQVDDLRGGSSKPTSGERPNEAVSPDGSSMSGVNDSPPNLW